MNACRVELSEANDFVAKFHRHHKPVVGHRFSIGAEHGGKLVGCVIVGRPVARQTDQKSIAEVTRLVTDGTKNACSFLGKSPSSAGEGGNHVTNREPNSSAVNPASTVSTAYDLLARCREQLECCCKHTYMTSFSKEMAATILGDIDQFLTSIDEGKVTPNATGSVQPDSDITPAKPSSGKTAGQVAKAAMNGKWQTDEAWEEVAQAVIDAFKKGEIV